MQKEFLKVIKLVGNSVKIDSKITLLLVYLKYQKTHIKNQKCYYNTAEEFEVDWGSHNNELFCRVI